MSVTKQLGIKIRSIRHQMGISQEELARLTGLHRTYVGGIERGERNPTIENIARIAKVLNVGIDELFK